MLTYWAYNCKAFSCKFESQGPWGERERERDRERGRERERERGRGRGRGRVH